MGLPAFNTVTASAAVIPPTRMHDPEYTNDQDQLWNYYQTLEEFSAAVNWKANAISRIRLMAAEFLPGGDEPTPITEGPVADAVARLAGGIGGQSQIIGEMAIHLNVPGEGWLVGVEDETFGDEVWQVYSANELRVKQGRYQLRVGESTRAWEDLSADSVVVRFWRPHPRWGWRATSRASFALGAMKELDFINRRIIAETISRMASNGLIVYDRGKLSFPNLPTPQGVESVDPFAQMLVDTGKRGIADPTSAEATIKTPIGADLGDADVKISDLIHVVDLSNPFSERMLEQRTAAVTRLATALDIPTEQLTGMGDLNHWGAAQIEEHGIKIHVAPDMETICHSLTEGYLYPMLRAEGRELTGPDGGRVVIWYDPSEITQRPDRSASATRAYDRLELSGEAYVRELGFSDSDRPDAAAIADMERLLEIRAKYGASNRSVSVGVEDNSDTGDSAEPGTSVEDIAPSASANGLRAV